MCLLGCPLLSCFEGLCVRYPCVMASAMCLLPRLPGGAMAERETVLGDGAARRDAAVQASLWNFVAEESSSVRAEGCARTGCVDASGRKTLAIGKQAGSTAKARSATLRGVLKHGYMSL